MFIVVFTPQQGHGVVAGIDIARKISDFIFDPVLFLPILILIFIYAFSYFSVQISAGRMGIMSVIVYLVIASVVVHLVNHKGKVGITYVTIVTKDSGKYATLVDENDKKVLDYRGTLPVQEVQTGYIGNAPYIVDIFSIFDPVITGIYIASFTIDAWEIRTLDRSSCMNPEEIFKHALSYPFEKTVEELKARNEINACLATYMSAFANQLREVREEAAKENRKIGEVVWERITEFRLPLPVMGICDPGGGGTVLNAKGLFWSLVEDALEQRLNECENAFAAKGYDKEKVKELVKQYIVKEGGNNVENFITVVHPQLSSLTEVIEGAGTSGLPSIGPLIQSMIKGVAVWRNRNTNFGFETKFALLLSAQGALLGIVIALSPLIFILSLIPIGGSIVNYKLMIGYLFSYFLISLWIPLLFLLYILVWGRAFTSAIQNVF